MISRAGPGPNRAAMRSREALAGTSISAPVRVRMATRMSARVELSAVIVSSLPSQDTCGTPGGICSGTRRSGRGGAGKVTSGIDSGTTSMGLTERCAFRELGAGDSGACWADTGTTIAAANPHTIAESRILGTEQTGCSTFIASRRLRQNILIDLHPTHAHLRFEPQYRSIILAQEKRCNLRKSKVPTCSLRRASPRLLPIGCRTSTAIVQGQPQERSESASGEMASVVPPTSCGMQIRTPPGSASKLSRPRHGKQLRGT